MTETHSESFKLSDRVKVIGKNTTGRIAFIGETHFSDGTMFGVVLDQPKGRYSGTVGGVKYFNCTKNYGVFVRECQLERVRAESSQKKPISARTYPNYLKNSSKLNLAKPNCKSKEYASSSDSKAQAVEELRSGSLKGEDVEVQGKDKTLRKRSEESIKIKLDENRQKLSEIQRKSKGELDAATAMLEERNRQLDVVRRSLEGLKAGLRWNKAWENGKNVKDRRIKSVFWQLVDGMIKTLEENISKVAEKHSEVPPNIGDGLREENNLLRQGVEELLKKNEVLTKSLKHVRNSLAREWMKTDTQKEDPCGKDQLKSPEQSSENVTRKQIESPRKKPSASSVAQQESCTTKSKSPLKQKRYNEVLNKLNDDIRKYLESFHFRNNDTNSDGEANCKQKTVNGGMDPSQDPETRSPLPRSERTKILQSNHAPYNKNQHRLEIHTANKQPRHQKDCLAKERDDSLLAAGDPTKELQDLISGIICGVNSAKSVGKSNEDAVKDDVVQFANFSFDGLADVSSLRKPCKKESKIQSSNFSNSDTTDPLLAQPAQSRVDKCDSKKKGILWKRYPYSTTRVFNKVPKKHH